MYKKILSWLLILLMIFTMVGGINISASGLGFNDVENHWAKDSINQWIEKGLIKGYSDGTFKPDGYITRGEFITLVNSVVNSEEEIEINFDDVTGDEWYYKELQKAIFLEYIKGYEDNTFRANQNISRQEVAVILQKLVQIEMSEENSLDSFNDTSDIPEWSRNALQLAVQKGYLIGYRDNSLKASNYITRAESVKVLSNLFGEVYNEEGIYGPAGDEDVLEVEGNMTVSVGNVTLQNMIIDGDLYLSEGIGKGEVTLDNITVTGETIVKGGGENSIIIKNSSLENLIIIKEDGKIRILAQGDTIIKSTQLLSGGKIQSEDINNFENVEIIKIKPGESIELEGSFAKIDVKTTVDIEVSGKSRVEELIVNKDTEDIKVKISPYSIISKIVANSEVSIDNRGIVIEALGEFADISTYENRLPVNLQPKTSSSPSTPAAPKYTLSLNVTPAGFGTVIGGGSYEEGKDITITASANEGYEFVEWKDGERSFSTSASFVYTMPSEDTTLTAEFKEKEFAGGSGTEVDPYQVETAEQLNKVRNHLGGNFIQTADIDLIEEYYEEDGIFYNEGKGWDPIGSELEPFTGSYNGDEKTISNLVINRPGEDYIGLFSKITQDSKLENIKIKGLIVEGNRHVGALVGSNEGHISKVNINGLSTSSIKGNSNNVGGLCGLNHGTILDSSTEYLDVFSIGDGINAGGLVGRSYQLYDYDTYEVIQESIIKDCYVDNVNIKGKSYSGGLIGDNDSDVPVENCWANVSVEGTHRVGGLIGMNEGDVYSSYSLGKVTGTDILNGMTGGLIGYSMNYFKVENCYSLADVQGPKQVGGLIGRTASYVTNCYSTGEVVGTDNKVEIGGLLGNLASIVEANNSYWDTETSGVSNSAGGTGVTGYSTSAMIKDTNGVQIYVDWDFTNNWNIEEGTSYPYFYWQGSENIPYPPSPFAGGSGIAGDPYQVATAEQLDKVRDYLDSHFIQTADIDLGVSPWNDGEGWVPIGLDTSTPFSGSYDGDEYNIGGLYIDRSEQSYQGLFGYTDKESSLTNINLLQAYVYGDEFVGSLVGYNVGEISNCSSEDVEILNSWEYAGGLVGRNSGSISNSSTTGIVKTDEFNAGGLVGYNRSDSVLNTTAKISNCYSEAEVAPITSVSPEGYPYKLGGLVGYNSKGVVENSYATGNVTGYEEIGGLIGENTADVVNSYATGNVVGTYEDIGGLIGENGGEVNNSYATGSVSGGDSVGGLAGDNSSTIKNSYNKIGTVTGSDNIGGLVGRNSGTITESHSESNVSGIENIGGLVGYSSSGEIKYSYTTGDVSCTTEGSGGLVGSVQSTSIYDCYATGSILGYEEVGGLAGYLSIGSSVSNCYSTGLVSGTISFGGLIGFKTTSTVVPTVDNSYYDTNTSGQSDTGKGTPKTTPEMKTESTYDGWDFPNTWTLNSTDNNGYPALAWQGFEHQEFAGGSGTAEDPYQVATAEQLNKVRDYLDKHFVQTEDINLTENVTAGGIFYNGSKGWNPIGTSENPFTGSFDGHFDGQEYSIANLKIDRSDQQYIGLFGNNEGDISNVSLLTVDVVGKGYVGGLIGYNAGGTVSLCNVSGSVNGTSGATGGLIGFIDTNGEVSKCYSEASVDASSSSYVGGLIGALYGGGSLSNSYATGSVTGGDDRIGGLVGYSYKGQIDRCFATGSVNGISGTGGLVGVNDSDHTTSVINSYWDTDTSGLGSSAGGEGKTTAEMMTSSTYINWDFDTIWNIIEAESYPYLRKNE